jgi:hypothetical protein
MQGDALVIISTNGTQAYSGSPISGSGTRALRPRPGREPIRSGGGSDGRIQEQRSHGRSPATRDAINDPRQGAGGGAYGDGAKVMSWLEGGARSPSEQVKKIRFRELRA